MARYEVSDESSSKFWEITLVGKTFTVRWGRIGSRGQQTVKHFADETKARKEYEKLVAEKRRKGYKLVQGTEEPEARKKRDAPSAPSGLRNADLERAVIADPNDEAALLVLADWLQTNGDPRGELIALQHALKHEQDAGQFVMRKRAAEEHYRAHEPALLGTVYDRRHLFKLEWQLGFIRTARVSYEAARKDDPDIATLVGELVEAPVALAMQELTLGQIGTQDPDGGRYQLVLDELARRAQPASLRTLFLGDYWPGAQPRADGQPLGDLSVLMPAFRGLRKLVLADGVAEFGDAEFPELRHFEERNAASVEWLVSAPKPKLEHLSLFAQNLYAGDVDPLFSAKLFPKLKQLRLFATGGTLGILEMLAESDLIAQLELVDLHEGYLEDPDTARLVELWPQFRHLKTLHLGNQRLTYGATKRLREKTGASLKVNDPRKYQQ